jgi:nucleoside-diphosphate kinase
MEKTLVLLKPDAVKRGVVGEVISRFEKEGLKILGTKMVHPDEEHYHHHYEGISKLKSRVGEPGTIRGDLGHMTLQEANSKKVGLQNIIHASGNLEEAKQEVEHWFKEEELFDY